MTGLEAMRRHVDALFANDAAGRLLRVRERDGAPAPRFFLGRTVDGAVGRYRADVDDALRRALTAAAAADPVTFGAGVVEGGRAAAPAQSAQPYVALLARAAPVTAVWGGPAFHFPADSRPSCRISRHRPASPRARSFG